MERRRPAFSEWPFFGTLIHKVLEDLFRHTRRRAATWPWLRGRFEERLFSSYGFLLSSGKSNFRARGLRILKGFWEGHRPVVGHRDLLEQRFRAPVGGFDVSGIIDRIERRSGRVRLVDYKSGRPDADGPDFRQLELYALAASRSLGQPPDLVAYHYLGDGSIHERAPAADELAATEDWVRNLGDGIARSEYTPRTGPHCRNCDFFRYCRPGKRWAREHGPGY